MPNLTYMRIVVAACLGAAALSMTSPARADKKAAARHYSEGTKAYNLGRFADAVASFEKAYDEDPAPILLFNIAQAHRQMGSKEKAIFFYRRYLEADPKSSNRPDVEKRMAELTAAIEADRRKPTEPPAPTSPAPASPVRAQPAAPPPAALPVAPSPPPVTPAPVETATGPRPMRIGAMVAGGVGVASLATGVFFGMRAQSLGDENSKAPTFDPSKDSAGKSAETMQFVFLGVGAAALVAGGVLFVLDRRQDETGSSVALAPVAVPGGAALVAGGRF